MIKEKVRGPREQQAANILQASDEVGATTRKRFTPCLTGANDARGATLVARGVSFVFVLFSLSRAEAK